MALAVNNPLLVNLRGRVGNLVFRQVRNKLVISSLPERDPKPPSPAQAAKRKRFKEATAYGRQVMENPEKSAAYELAAKLRGTSVMVRCIADFLNAPTVEHFDLSQYQGRTGGWIRLRARDDFEVIGVVVRLKGADGAVLETGPAVKDPASDDWQYRAKVNLPAGQSVTVEAVATDRPGNQGHGTASWPLKG